MKLKIKLLNSLAKLPTYASEGAACFDFFASTDSQVTVDPHSAVSLPTGLSFEIPEGYVMLVFSRSGHGFKHGIRLNNCVGVIDSDYRGEMRVGLHNDSDMPYIVQPSERVAQGMLIPAPQMEIEAVPELSKTKRGTGGFGSTGK